MSDNVTRSPRERISIRLSPIALAEVDQWATERDTDRSHVLRDLLRLGSVAYREGRR